MSIDRPSVSPALSDHSGPSFGSRTTKRWSGAGLISSSGGTGLNAVSVELGDFEDIDLGQDRDPGDGDTTPKLRRGQSELHGLGISRSRSPFDGNETPNGSKFWRRQSPKRGSIASISGSSVDQPAKSGNRDSSRPISRRKPSIPSSLNLENVTNGHLTNAQKPSRHRRTSSEIDRMYDSDDSVPPETVFSNVPVSPGVNNQKGKFEKFPGTLELEEKRPPTVAEEDLQLDGSPMSLVPNADFSQRPVSASFPRRVVSYHEAMSALDEESQRLTRELNKMNLQADDRSSEETLPGVSALPALMRQSRRAASHTHLPSTTTLIDPLPASKEKEAVLSQTRPSWLPPKKKSEEKRHLAEYQRMVQMAEEAEHRRQEKARREKEERDRLYEDSSKVWQTYILPNWDKTIRDPRTRELWWSGIPSPRRGVVWLKCIGNELAITEDTYQKALSRVRAAEIAVREPPGADEIDVEALSGLFRRIVEDTAFVFPELKLFQWEGPMHQDLVSVTKAYTFYRSDHGYTPQIQSVAAAFLINLTPFESFVALGNMLNRPLPLAFMSNDAMAKHKFYTIFDNLFYANLDSLHSYFSNTLRLHPSAYLDRTLGSLFAGYMPLDVLSRIWDAYGFEGDIVLLRAAVGVLSHFEPRLYVDKKEVLQTLTTGRWDLGKEEVFMKKVWGIRVNI